GLDESQKGETNELYRLALVAFCLLSSSWGSDKLGLSLELGSFVAGVGHSLVQIEEFAFVLLSQASNLNLVEGKMRVLLLGTTVSSLVSPFLYTKEEITDFSQERTTAKRDSFAW
ncbi:K(+) efflux antiporter 5-like protein, partial [Drosera capensis]